MQGRKSTNKSLSLLHRQNCVCIFFRRIYFLVLLLVQASTFCFGFVYESRAVLSRRLNNVVVVFSNLKSKEDISQDKIVDSTLSRRSILQSPFTLVGFGAYGYVCIKSLQLSSRDEITYPKPHEARVTSIILKTFQNAANSFRSSQSRPFRVLEVGIGKDCRLIRRGLYDPAITVLQSFPNIKSIELSGVDFRLPDEKTYEKSKSKINVLSEETGMEIRFAAVDGSIVDRSSLPWDDGYFDAIICSLTLCSVDDVNSATINTKRLLRPHGGTFGYVEHVAVIDSERSAHRLLEIQQRVLDPLQQALVDNCHLHRYNDDEIRNVFDDGSAMYLEKDRFYVDEMWPVCCQCSGVIQLV